MMNSVLNNLYRVHYRYTYEQKHFVMYNTVRVRYLKLNLA